MGSTEIDFVAERGQQRWYIQVTWSMANEVTRERELAPLRQITDAFPRLVLTMDRTDVGTGVTADGIQIMHAVDWLLGEGTLPGQY
ncbi:ATP-binding protein [Bifidobacterium gallicum]|nr:ATP-binding protein [Bifidobacterium gallicum]